MATLPLENKIKQSAKHKATEKVLTANYGNGFSQRAIIGENQKADTWSLTYGVLSQSDRDTLYNFWSTHGNHLSFDWTAFGDTFNKKWIFSGSFSESALSCDRFSVTLNIQQVFDL